MKKQIKQTVRKIKIIVSLTLIVLTLLLTLTTALPSGPSGIVYGANSTGSNSAAQMVNISGGYISKFNLTASTQNTHWKAFVGEVDGKFTLDDASGSTIYDWTLSTISGEVYATKTSSSITWTGIGCATAGEITSEDTALEHRGEDNITSTFSSTNLQPFIVAGASIGTGACSATNTYNSTGKSLDFEEVVLATATSEIVFASILEQDALGYDDGRYDFQMIVPENANESKGLTTAYYLYVELGS